MTPRATLLSPPLPPPPLAPPPPPPPPLPPPPALAAPPPPAEAKAIDLELVACGTRLSISSWTDPKRGVGCGRDHIVARMNAIAKQSGGKLQVVVDKFEST